jgi:hypothetical protein
LTRESYALDLRQFTSWCGRMVLTGSCLCSPVRRRRHASRERADRLYNIRRWTPMPGGGHFPSAEEPDLLSRDIAAFFNDLGGDQPAMTRQTG